MHQRGTAERADASWSHGMAGLRRHHCVARRRRGKSRDTGTREAAAGADRGSGDAASGGDWRLHGLLRLDRSRHASWQDVPARQSPAAQLQVRSILGIMAAHPLLWQSGAEIRRPFGQTKRGSKRAGFRTDTGTRLRIGSGPIFVGLGNRLGQSHTDGRSRGAHLRTVPCPTTGRRATFRRGSINRWGLFWQRVLPRRFLRGLFRWRRWLRIALPPANARRAIRSRSRICVLRMRSGRATGFPILSLPVLILPASIFGWRFFWSRAGCARRERRRCSWAGAICAISTGTIAQLVTHHTCNGCNLRAGDLLGTGTVSGPDAGSEGCLLEKRSNAEPIRFAWWRGADLLGGWRPGDVTRLCTGARITKDWIRYMQRNRFRCSL